jgi:hypothetical protein
MGSLRARYAKLNAEIIDNSLKRARYKDKMYRNKKGVRPMTKGEFKYAVVKDLGLLEGYYDDVK